MLAAEQWVQLLRRSCRDKLLRMVRELTLTAHWDTWESWPGWDRLMEVSGWARSTMAGWLRQLRLLGWLTVIESGTTPQYRPLALAHIEGNRRAVYALRVPLRPAEPLAELPPARSEPALPLAELEARAETAWRSDPVGVGTGSELGRCRAVEQTWTPTRFSDFLSSVDQWVSSRAKSFFHNSQVQHKTETLRTRLDQEYLAFADQVPTTGAQMLAAAAELRHQHPVLARLTIRAIRALCRPYWRAEWTNTDVLHALEYRPTSWSTLPAMEAAKVLAPYRWAQARLCAWRTESGRVLPGHSRTERDQRTREHAVMTRHGRAALTALPAGAAWLRPADVRRYGRSRVDAALETLRRNRAAELSDQRAAVRPPEQVASPTHRSQMSAEIRDEREPRRAQQQAELHERLLAQARAAQAQRQDQAQPEARSAPPAPTETTPQDSHELALARARAEGRLPLIRRRRHRARW